MIFSAFLVSNAGTFANFTLLTMARSRDDADNKKCIRMLRCVRKPCPTLHRTEPQIIYTFKYPQHHKKINSLAYDIQKNWFLEYHFGQFSDGWFSQTMSNYFFKLLLIKKKKLNALGWANQKLIFGGPWGVMVPPKYVKTFVA